MPGESTVLDQRVARIAFNEQGRWWNGLSDTTRRALLSGNLSMAEYAFKAGVRAALETEGTDHG